MYRAGAKGQSEPTRRRGDETEFPNTLLGFCVWVFSSQKQSLERRLGFGIWGRHRCRTHRRRRRKEYVEFTVIGKRRNLLRHALIMQRRPRRYSTPRYADEAEAREGGRE